MGKAVLFSIHPQHCYNIAVGFKTLELRKKIPKLQTPYKGYIYCTKERGKIEEVVLQPDNLILYKQGFVCMEFICDWTDEYYPCDWGHAATAACVSMDDIYKYLDGKSNINGLHISDLIIYEKPKELSEFYHWCGWSFFSVERPPQSWMYVEELK